MRLEIFNFIEETVEILKNNLDELKKIEEEIDLFFSDTFFSKDHFIDVKSRVKGVDSLKEKILRNNLFLQYNEPKELLENLSDIIGVRIECRFIDDERRIYNEIKNLFRLKAEDGYYLTYMNNRISLKMDEEQPQRQKNGFQIYKIDGKYSNGDVTYLFELQIKSLVNVFWGDIDHKILYKNFNYSLTERFIMEIMSSIKENLGMIDRELMLLYNHINEIDVTSPETIKKEVKVLLSKNLHDIYYKKVKHELGFPVDFRKSCNAIIDYLFMKQPPRDDAYMNLFLRLMKRMRFLESKNMDFTENVLIPENLQYVDNFTRTIGEKLSFIVKRDFNWSLFFRILFDIEEGDFVQIVSQLLIFVKNKYYEAICVALANFDFSEKMKSDVTEFVMQLIADDFNENSQIALISDDNMNRIHRIIIESIGEVVDIWNYDEIKETIKNNFYQL